MKNERAYLEVYDMEPDAFNALRQGEVEVVVYDAPNLLYYANNEGKGLVSLVGKIFEPQDCVLAFPGAVLCAKRSIAPYSGWRKPVNWTHQGKLVRR